MSRPTPPARDDLKKKRAVSLGAAPSHRFSVPKTTIRRRLPNSHAQAATVSIHQAPKFAITAPIRAKEAVTPMTLDATMGLPKSDL